MKPKFQFNSVRSRLVFLFAVTAVIPLIVVSAFIYQQRARAIRDSEFDKLTAIRDLKVEQVNAWLDERTGDIRTIAADEEIRTAGDLSNKAASGENHKTRFDIARRLLVRYVENYKSFCEVFIVDALSGKVAFSSRPAAEGADRRTDDYFTGPMRSGQVHIKDIYHSGIEDKPSMAFSFPIFSMSGEDRVTGIVVARINLERSLYRLLLQRTGLGKTGETLIVNKDVIALNKLRWNENDLLNLEIKAESAVKAARGETGVTETTDYRNEKVLAAYTHIPRTGWGFVAKQDLAETYAPIVRMFRSLLLICTLFILAIVIIALLTARGFSKPLLQMTAVSRKLREGDLSARNRVARADELGFLGKVFNTMADSITDQVKIHRDLSALTRVMVETKSLDSFGRAILQKIIEITGSSFGVFYVLDPAAEQYTHLCSIGANPTLLGPFDAHTPEGEIGAAVAAGEVLHTKDIPADTPFTFRAFAGTVLPREIVTLPIIVEERTAAVISIASLHPYSAGTMETLKLTRLILDTALSNLLAGEKTRRLADDLQAKNIEISTANEELRARSEELNIQTHELEHQARELEAQKSRVLESDRLKSEFLSNMSHELRTPLNSVLSLSQLMLAKGTGKDIEKEAKFLEIIERNGRLLLNLINDILDLSRIESGRMDLNCDRFEPSLTVERAVDTVKSMARSKGLKLETQIHHVPPMFSDQDKVRQIMLNLLSNAVKFTKKGHIRVTVEAEGERVRFTVEDTGIGIPKTGIGHIFDEFRQVDGSVTREYEGTGLGLAISQKYARLLGGKITVKSRPGKGSVFTLDLPLECEAGNEEIPGPSVPTPGALPLPRGKTPHVLVVEDNRIAAMQVRAVLEERGFSVATAADGAAGLRRVKEKTPDAIVLDLMMPGVDGFNLLDKLRSTPGTAGIPVLVLTAKELTKKELSQLKRNNIRQLIQKGSLDREQLGGAVEKLFDVEPVSKAEIVFKKGPAESRTLLVVEDNPDNLVVIANILTDAGYTFITAGDGKKAVTETKRARPGLLLMDIQLPGKSGLDAAKEIKADPGLAHIPIIALTAKAMKGDKEKILAAGCDDYVSKPIAPAVLLEKIRRWLGE